MFWKRAAILLTGLFIILLCILYDRGRGKVEFIYLPDEEHRLPSGLTPKWDYATIAYSTYPEYEIIGPLCKLGVYHNVYMSSDEICINVYRTPRGTGGNLLFKDQQFDIYVHESGTVQVSQQYEAFITSDGIRTGQKPSTFKSSVSKILESTVPPSDAAVTPECYSLIREVVSILYNSTKDLKTETTYGLYFKWKGFAHPNKEIPSGTW